MQAIKTLPANVSVRVKFQEYGVNEHGVYCTFITEKSGARLLDIDDTPFDSLPENDRVEATNTIQSFLENLASQVENTRKLENKARISETFDPLVYNAIIRFKTY